jgi:hypothetical protein
MKTYKVTLIEKVRVYYMVESENAADAIEKAKSGDARFVDSNLLGMPDDSYEIEEIEE